MEERGRCLIRQDFCVIVSRGELNNSHTRVAVVGGFLDK